MILVLVGDWEFVYWFGICLKEEVVIVGVCLKEEVVKRGVGYSL